MASTAEVLPVRACAPATAAHSSDSDAEKALALFALMPSVGKVLRQAAASTADVLVRGEPGAGKELFARALHALSSRAGQPFVRVVCGSSLAAEVDPQVWLEEVRNGSLFLDEVADLAPSAQLSLVRMLQTLDGAGHGSARHGGPRLICSSARSLEAMVAAGDFRADLYYRVHVVAIELPALRRLPAREIHALAEFFLARSSGAAGRSVRLSALALRRLEHCRWPGNLRQMENCIENVATQAVDDTVSACTMPCTQCLARVLATSTRRSGQHAVAVSQTAQLPVASRQEGQRTRLVAALERCGWVQAKAARMLGMTQRQLGYAIRKLEIQVQRF